MLVNVIIFSIFPIIFILGVKRRKIQCKLFDKGILNSTLFSLAELSLAIKKPQDKEDIRDIGRIKRLWQVQIPLAVILFALIALKIADHHV